MNKFIPAVGVSLLGLLTWSCSGESRLAGELAGMWTGTPENFTDNTAITASIIDTYDFLPDTCDSHGHYAGPLTVTGMISTSTQVVGDSSLIEPVSLTAAAKSTISGSWVVIDDDEILIRLDPSTLSISVDPSDIQVGSNPLSTDTISVGAIRPGLKSSIETGLRQALINRYASSTHFDDVKIKGALMKYEINDIDKVLTRQ